VAEKKAEKSEGLRLAQTDGTPDKDAPKPRTYEQAKLKDDKDSNRNYAEKDVARVGYFAPVYEEES
jgi:hypothetical protein